VVCFCFFLPIDSRDEIVSSELNPLEGITKDSLICLLSQFGGASSMNTYRILKMRRSMRG
jgi:hypothetical protein